MFIFRRNRVQPIQEYSIEFNLTDNTVIAGHGARRSMEDTTLLVARLPLRLTATVLDATDRTAVLQRTADTLAVDGRPDLGH